MCIGRRVAWNALLLAYRSIIIVLLYYDKSVILQFFSTRCVPKFGSSIKNFLTMPVATATCERSFSKL